MFKGLVIISVIVSIIFGTIFFHPDLDIFIKHVHEECCKNGTCSLETKCFPKLQFLARRCGNDWNQLYNECLQSQGFKNSKRNTIYCTFSTTCHLNDILRNCYYYYDEV